MRKVRILETDKIVEVSNNVAFGLVDSGKATLDLKSRFNRQLQPQLRKRYRTK